MKLFFIFSFMITFLQIKAQVNTDQIYAPGIKTVKLFKVNNQASMPVIRLNSADQLELHFDDLSGDPKNYYYTIELCNADWQSSDLSSFDYIKGYQQQSISNYTVSSYALKKFVHYSMLFPEKDCQPSKSGNYLLKVFLDADPEKIVFAKRFFVVQNEVAVTALVRQTFDAQRAGYYQKVQLSINTMQLNVYSVQQQLKIAVIQNYEWINTLTDVQPTFINNNLLEYNNEDDFVFAGGRENRWVDLRSFSFKSERIATLDKAKVPVQIWVKPDGPRSGVGYFSMKDLNGWYLVSSTEVTDPWVQGDYANVHFVYVTPDRHPFDNKELYLLGEITGNGLTKDARMNWNDQENVYEKDLVLKQGYYSYCYGTRDLNSKEPIIDYSLTEGNFWETENDYTVFVYYRSISGRYDELVTVKNINSLSGKL